MTTVFTTLIGPGTDSAGECMVSVVWPDNYIALITLLPSKLNTKEGVLDMIESHFLGFRARNLHQHMQHFVYDSTKPGAELYTTYAAYWFNRKAITIVDVKEELRGTIAALMDHYAPTLDSCDPYYTGYQQGIAFGRTWGDLSHCVARSAGLALWAAVNAHSQTTQPCLNQLLPPSKPLDPTSSTPDKHTGQC